MSAAINGTVRGQSLNGTVSLIPISANNSSAIPYYATDINSCSVDLNNLITDTVGGVTYQFCAFYDTGGHIWLSRRTPGVTGSTSWTTVETNITLSTSLLTDDHNTIAIAVDSTGHLNMAWGMHNVQLNYAISSASVMGSGTFAAPTMNVQNTASLFPGGSAWTNEATYPDFYNIPGSSNLLFAYRNGGAGGGSGNGNEYFDIYNPTASAGSQWTGTFVTNGEQTSVNAYLNNLVYDSNNNLLMSWTWRASSDWQTNSNIMFAQSADDGIAWSQQGGSPAYTLPIIQTGTPAASVAQVVKAIPQNSSFINQTSMAVDRNNNPIVATYWAPGTQTSPGVWTGTNANNAPNTQTNNPNLQYMLEYYDGTQWRTSQISNRTSDTVFDGNAAAYVRDLGRPIVVVDKSNRVLVLTRSEDTSQGSFTNPSTPNNGYVIYWNTAASLDSASPMAWQTIALSTATMGESEPTIDANAWNLTNILDVMYEPTDLSGATSEAVSELEWNEPQYFASNTPTSLTWDSNIGAAGAQDGSGTWDTTNLNFYGSSNNWAWNNSLALSVTFGSASAAAGTVTLGNNVTASNLTFNAASSGNYTIAGGGFTLSLASGANIAANANATISAPISGPGFTKTGAGTLTLSGSNTFTGTLAIGTGATSGGNVGGAVYITSAAAVNGLTLVNLNDSGTAFDFFQIDGTGGNISLPPTLNFSLAGATSNNADNVIESIAGNNTINGNISPTGSGAQFAVQSDSGLFTVAGNFNLGALTGSRTLNLQGAGNGQWSGVLGNGSGGGTLALTKGGAGSWTLSNVNTYTGPTLVSAGTLAITGSIASTGLTVSSGAALNAAGTSNDGLATGTTLSVTGTATLAAGILGGGITPRTVSSVTINNGGLVQVANPASHADRQVLITSGLSFTGTTGKLDLASNDLIVHNANSTAAATELTAITSQLEQGSANGWTGTGGVVSTAAASAGNTALAVELNNNGTGGTWTTSFDAQTVTNTDILVKYTLYGDANFDGTVNGSDYAMIDNGFNAKLTGWRNGDFNYDGVVNGDDYLLIDNAFNTEGAASYAADSAGPTEMIATETSQIATVPEPASLGLMAVAAVGLLPRRRARCPRRSFSPRLDF
jgi:autotransporter-associated beta strand protein